jgi:hypothetical protein
MKNDEKKPASEITDAVKAVAGTKASAFGPTDRELIARKAELQRQKVELLTHDSVKGEITHP